MEDAEYQFIQQECHDTAMYSLKLNASLRTLLRKHTNDDISIEFLSADHGCLHIGLITYSFTIRQENFKECYTIQNIGASAKQLTLLGPFSGRMAIQQSDMNEDTAASLKQKTETARADRNKRKAIAVSDTSILGSKKKFYMGDSGARVNSGTTSPRAVKVPEPATLAVKTATPKAPLLQQLHHNWVVLRCIPTVVTVRDVEAFFEGISLKKPMAVPDPTSVPSRSACIPMFAAFLSKSSGEFVDVYVEMASAHGAVLAAKRSGEPLLARCCPHVDSCAGHPGLSAAELFWARGVGVEIIGKCSVEESTLSLTGAGVPLQLVRSPRSSLHPAALVDRWPSFSSAISAAFCQGSGSHPLAHIFRPSSESSGSLPAYTLSDPSEGCSSGPQSELTQLLPCDVREVRQLLAALGEVWVGLALAMAHVPAEGGTVSAVKYVGRALAAFRCLDRFLVLGTGWSVGPRGRKAKVKR